MYVYVARRAAQSLGIDSTSSSAAGRPVRQFARFTVSQSVIPSQSPIDMTQQQSYPLSLSLSICLSHALASPLGSFYVLIKYLRAWPLFQTKATANT